MARCVPAAAGLAACGARCWRRSACLPVSSPLQTRNPSSSPPQCACPEGKADGGSGECLAVPGGCNVELCARCADGRPDLCEECTTGYVTWGNPLGTSVSVAERQGAAYVWTQAHGAHFAPCARLPLMQCNVIRPIPCDVYGCYTCLEGDKNQCTLTGCAPGFTLTPEGQVGR